MDFVGLMLFTQQVFHLEYVFFFFDSFWYLRLLLFRIKSQPGVVYKSVVYKKACSVVFQSSKNEEMTLLHEFIFVFIQYFIGATKSLVYKIQKGGIAI